MHCGGVVASHPGRGESAVGRVGAHPGRTLVFQKLAALSRCCRSACSDASLARCCACSHSTRWRRSRSCAHAAHCASRCRSASVSREETAGCAGARRGEERTASPCISRASTGTASRVNALPSRLASLRFCRCSPVELSTGRHSRCSQSCSCSGSLSLLRLSTSLEVRLVEGGEGAASETSSGRPPRRRATDE